MRLRRVSFAPSDISGHILTFVGPAQDMSWKKLRNVEAYLPSAVQSLRILILAIQLEDSRDNLQRQLLRGSCHNDARLGVIYSRRVCIHLDSTNFYTAITISIHHDHYSANFRYPILLHSRLFFNPSKPSMVPPSHVLTSSLTSRTKPRSDPPRHRSPMKSQVSSVFCVNQDWRTRCTLLERVLVNTPISHFPQWSWSWPRRCVENQGP